GPPARQIADRRRLRTDAGPTYGGVIQIRPVEYIREFGSKIHRDFLMEPEQTSKPHVFDGAALSAEIALERSIAELARGRVGPGRRIQNKAGLRIEAVAVQVLSE